MGSGQSLLVAKIDELQTFWEKDVLGPANAKIQERVLDVLNAAIMNTHKELMHRMAQQEIDAQYQVESELPDEKVVNVEYEIGLNINDFTSKSFAAEDLRSMARKLVTLEQNRPVGNHSLDLQQQALAAANGQATTFPGRDTQVLKDELKSCRRLR